MRSKLKAIPLAGIVECIVEGVPIGLGSHVQWDRKLDSRIAGAVVSINAFKGCEIGIGFEGRSFAGLQVHDEILYDEEKGDSGAFEPFRRIRGRYDQWRADRCARCNEATDTVQAVRQRPYIHTKEPFTAQVERSESLRRSCGKRSDGCCGMGSGKGVSREVRRGFC